MEGNVGEVTCKTKHTHIFILKQIDHDRILKFVWKKKTLTEFEVWTGFSIVFMSVFYLPVTVSKKVIITRLDKRI